MRSLPDGGELEASFELPVADAVVVEGLMA
jgi:hypothetical protein